MVGVDGLAPGGDAARDVEAGLAREESSDSLDVAPDGSVRPAESATLGAFGRDDDDHLAVAEVVEDLVRERSASARRGRASKSKTGADAKTPPRARPRAEPKPRPAVNVSPSVFRPPIRVVHASRGDPLGHDDDANDDGVRDDARASGAANVPREDGVGVGIGTGDAAAVESSPSESRRRGRVVPPSRILDARAIMDACAASRPSECFRANLTGRRLAAVDAEELRVLSSHVSLLRVDDNELEGEDVAALASLASLRVLDASANAVRIIPAEPFALRRALEPEMPGTLRGTLPFASLARLDLSFNALDHRCLATLSALAALERLNLSDNRVDELPTNLFARHDEDAFSAFEDGLDADAGAYRDGAFAPFPSLRRLRLSRQTPRLTSRRCDWVATLARLPKLARLSVDGNALDGVRAGSNPTRAETFRPGTDFPRLVALNLAGNPVRRVDALAALTPLAATTRRRDARETNATFGLRRERIRTDGVCEDDSSSDGSDDEGDEGNISANAGRLEEIHIGDTPLGETLAEEGDREGLRRAFAFGGSSRRSARARGRAEALASGALTTTRRARFGDGECDAVAAPLAGALVATLEPARILPNAASLTLKPFTLHRETRPGFVAVRDDARPRRDDDALRFAVDDDASTRAVTRRLDDFTRAAKIRDLATSYAVAKRNDAAAKKRENSRDAERNADDGLRTPSNPFEPVRTGRVVEDGPGTRSESSSFAERRAPAPPPSDADDERDAFAETSPHGTGTLSRSARLERRLLPGKANAFDVAFDDETEASRANGAAGRVRAASELRRALRPRATPRENGNRSSTYARATAATTAKTTPTARLTSARRRVDAEGRARVRTVEEIVRDLE